MLLSHVTCLYYKNSICNLISPHSTFLNLNGEILISSPSLTSVHSPPVLHAATQYPSKAWCLWIIYKFWNFFRVENCMSYIFSFWYFSISISCIFFNPSYMYMGSWHLVSHGRFLELHALKYVFYLHDD